MICETPEGTRFEAPDAWLAEVGADLVRRSAQGFRPTEDPAGFEVRIVRLTEIRPPGRGAGVRGLDPDRAAAILRGFAADEALPPVRVVDLPDRGFRYRVRDGFHRYHLSIAWGFTHLPVAIDPWAEEWM